MAFPNPNKYSQNTQNLSRYPNNKLEVLSIMCNKNGETHPLSKFPPSEWEVRWKHKSVVEGTAICNERDLLPSHGVLGKARQGKQSKAKQSKAKQSKAKQSKAKQRRVCMREDWDSIEIFGWWTINLHTQRTKLTNSYNDEQVGFHIHLSRAKPWWAMEGIEWNW